MYNFRYEKVGAWKPDEMME